MAMMHDTVMLCTADEEESAVRQSQTWKCEGTN